MRIAIIGGGASGALTSLHLARALPPGAGEIAVIELAEEIGRGLAYSTDDPRHLLNVRVANMSAFADEPDHLSQWLQNKGPSVARLTPLCFISRSIYGTYMADIVQELGDSGTVRHVRDRCVDLVQIGDEVVLRLETGGTIITDLAILATGNDAKPALNGIPAVQPWTEDTLKNLSAHLPVLIVGTGLAMVDMALSLDRRGHTGKITAVSPRGLLSSVHRPVNPFAIFAKDVPFGAELSKVSSWLRQLCAMIMEQAARQPNPGRRSTYRGGKSVQTTGTTSALGHHIPWIGVPKFHYFHRGNREERVQTPLSKRGKPLRKCRQLRTQRSPQRCQGGQPECYLGKPRTLAHTTKITTQTPESPAPAPKWSSACCPPLLHAHSDGSPLGAVCRRGALPRNVVLCRYAKVADFTDSGLITARSDAL
jgi:hypothetical protein